MKIAFNLLPYRYYSGIEVFTDNLIREYIRDNQNDEIVIIKHTLTPSNFNYNAKNVETVTLKLKSHYKGSLAMIQQFRLWYQLIKIKPDFLINTSASAPLFYKRSVTTLHDCAYDRYPEYSSELSKLYFKIMFLNAKYFSAAIITISEFSKKELITLYGISSSKINILTVATPALPRTSSKQDNAVLKRFMLVRKQYFIYIGSIRPRKNILGSLEGFKSAHLPPETQFVIIGRDDKTFIDLPLYIREHKIDQVKLTGFIPDNEKVSLLKNAIGLVFPSFYEGFGIPPLEAQSLGVPVITSNNSSLPEVVGNSAMTINPFEVSDIRHGLESLLSEENRKKLVKKGYKNIKRFKWSSSASELRKILRSLNEDSASR